MMKPAVLLGCFVAAVCGGPVVDLPGLGKIEGIRKANMGVDVDRFLGVRYGTAGRWENPEAETAWSGTRDATKFGAVCPGAWCLRDFPQLQGEDCLFLNVFAPSKPASEKLPVLMWIHGGDNNNGCSNAYHGETLVARSNSSIIVVTINYRLNVFGWLASKDLKGKDGSTGNWGLQDQRLAMNWIHKNIAVFGGDPDALTIQGQSAGAWNVQAHMSSPRSKGLFKRAIPESGLWNPAGQEINDASFHDTMVMLNCTTVACMKAAPWEAVEKTKKPSGNGTVPEGSYQPTIDGVDLFADPFQSEIKGDVSGYDIMAGSTRDEVAFAAVFEPLMDEAAYDAIMLGVTGSLENLRKVKELYNSTNFKPPKSDVYSFWWWAVVDGITDMGLTCPNRRAGQVLAKTNNVYLYWMVHATKTQTMVPGTGPFAESVPHAAEIPYVFDCPVFPLQDDCKWEHQSEADLAASIQHFWINFVKTGNPGPSWERYQPTSDNRMHLDVSVANGGGGLTMHNNVKKAQCDFWDVVYKPRAKGRL